MCVVVVVVVVPVADVGLPQDLPGAVKSKATRSSPPPNRLLTRYWYWTVRSGIHHDLLRDSADSGTRRSFPAVVLEISTCGAIEREGEERERERREGGGTRKALWVAMSQRKEFPDLSQGPDAEVAADSNGGGGDDNDDNDNDDDEEEEEEEVREEEEEGESLDETGDENGEDEAEEEDEDEESDSDDNIVCFGQGEDDSDEVSEEEEEGRTGVTDPDAAAASAATVGGARGTGWSRLCWLCCCRCC